MSTNMFEKTTVKEPEKKDIVKILAVYTPLIYIIGLILCYFIIYSSCPNVDVYLYDTSFSGFIRKGKNQRIFDTWMYNNEAEMAYIRLWRLYDLVDYFIIVVANNSHSGLGKNISFYPYDKEIEQFRDKMRIVYTPHLYCKPEYKRGNTRAWCIERSQRDYGYDYMKENFNLTEDDIILVSDCDEIFTRDAVKFISEHPPKTFYFVKGHMYFPYYFHYQEQWDLGFVLRYQHHFNRTLSSLRVLGHIGPNKEDILQNDVPFITHCTWCFKDIEQYQNKIRSFGHQEFNRPPYITPDFIFKSHYCRDKINSGPNHYDLNITDYYNYLPDDPRLRFLYDRSFEYDIKRTKYTHDDLKTLCQREFDRRPIVYKQN